MGYNIKMLNELLAKLEKDKDLTEKDLRDIKEKALLIRDEYTRCRTLIAIAEYPKVSLELIKEIKEHISTKIKDGSNKTEYLNQVEQASTVKQLYIELNEKNLTENKLREIKKRAISNIKNEYTKGKVLISIAEHRRTPLKLVKEIKKYISNEIKYEETKIRCSEIIDKILTDKSNACKIREQLENTKLTEEELGEIAKTASTIKTDCEKYKALVAVAEHPKASIELITQDIKKYVSEIDDEYYTNSYADKIMDIWLNRLKNKNLTEKELGKIAEVSWKIVDNDKTRQDTFFKNVFITVAEHPQTSSKFLLGIEYAARRGCSKNSYEEVCKKTNAKRRAIEAQQLKQCEGELGNLSTSKNIKSNGRQ